MIETVSPFSLALDDSFNHSVGEGVLVLTEGMASLRSPLPGPETALQLVWWGHGDSEEGAKENLAQWPLFLSYFIATEGLDCFSFLINKTFYCDKIHNIQFPILTIFKCMSQWHSVQPSAPSITRTSSFSHTETLSPGNTNSPFLSVPNPWHSPFYFLSLWICLFKVPHLRESHGVCPVSGIFHFTGSSVLQRVCRISVLVVAECVFCGSVSM